MKWFIFHLVPRVHWTRYIDDGAWFVIWRQWLWYTWDETYIKVDIESEGK